MGRIKAFHLDSGGQSIGSNSIGDKLTNSIAPHAGRLVIAVVTSNRQGGSSVPNVPTLTGAGMTWDEILSINFTTAGEERITVFKAMSTTPGTGALTISHGGQPQEDIYWEITEFSNVARTGSNGADAIVQNGWSKQATTTPTVSLSPFASPHNGAYGVTYLNDNGPAISPGSGFTKIDEFGGSHIVQAEFSEVSNPSVNWSITGGAKSFLSIALELKASFSGGGAMFLL